MRNDALGIGQPTGTSQPAAKADAATETTLRRLASGPGKWLLRALCTRTPDLSTFSDAQLRDIGLTRVDVDRFG